ARRHDLLLLSDEAYDHTVYDGRRHISIGSLPEARGRTVTVCSFTKSYAMRHWRLGFIAGPAVLMPGFRKVLEWNVFQCNHVTQYAGLAALEGPQEWVADIGRRFGACRDIMVDELRGAPGLSFSVPMGGPFLF